MPEPDDHYNLDFHRAMEAAYQRQAELQTIQVHKDDYRFFQLLCARYNYSAELMFHTLIRNA